MPIAERQPSTERRGNRRESSGPPNWRRLGRRRLRALRRGRSGGGCCTRHPDGRRAAARQRPSTGEHHHPDHRCQEPRRNPFVMVPICGFGITMQAAMKTAIVHDWLTGMRGGEKVLEVLCERFPTPSCSRCCTSPARCRRPSSARRSTRRCCSICPASAGYYRQCLPLFPVAVEQFDLERVRSGHQQQPLRGQIGDRPAGRGPRLLLPHADALRLGPVRRLLRPRSAGPDRQRGRCGRVLAATGAVGPRHGRARAPLCREFPICCAAGSADTIIARPLWCIRPSTPSSSVRTRRVPRRQRLL